MPNTAKKKSSSTPFLFSPIVSERRIFRCMPLGMGNQREYIFVMDTVSPEKRSWMMARIRGKNTKPEKSVRSLLHGMGYRFRLHGKRLPGKPDIVLPKHKVVIFVHGCFWHGHEGCKRATLPTTRQDFWNKKISGNKERDRRNITALEALGYRCLIVWQCEIKDTESLNRRLSDFIGGK